MKRKQPKITKYATDPWLFFSDLYIPTASGPVRFGSVAVDFQREWLQTICPSLLALLANKPPPIPRAWLEGTKGSGKDLLVAMCVLFLLAFSRRKLEIEIGAADRDQARELHKQALDLMRLNGWLTQRIDSHLHNLICRQTGSECRVLSCDTAGGAHGSRPNVVIVNEIGHIPDSRREFPETLLDNLSKDPNGLGLVLTNAGDRTRWQWNWRQIALDRERWHHFAYTEPAPWITPDELSEAEQRMSKSRFERLYHGTWSCGADALDLDSVQECVSDEPFPWGQGGWGFVAGLDLGIRHDHTAITIIAYRTDSQRLWLAHVQSWKPTGPDREVDLVQVESTIMRLHRRYKFELIYDPYSAALLVQRLRRQGVKVAEMAFVGVNLNRMASDLLQTFRNRAILIPDDPALLADLHGLSIEERSFGYKLVAERTVAGGHGDRAISMSICLPRAIELAGTKPLIVGPWGCERLDTYESRFTQDYARSDYLSELREEERNMDDQSRDHNALFRLHMSQEGRIPRR